MKNPAPVHLSTDEYVMAGGWAAASRDRDGHLMTTHAPFETDAEMVEYVWAELGRGYTVILFPEKEAANAAET